ncbi:MAG: hypothetical protein JXR37_11065 [Kiritimatiellae bacterium]|nr:hypothetical protein [Kiritimatiellia bacterium]
MTVVVFVKLFVELEPFQLDLLFEERVRYQRGRAGLFDPVDCLHIRRQGARAGDNRVGECYPHVC